MANSAFTVLQIDHIGVAVNETAPLTTFLKLLGIHRIGSETIVDQRVSTEMYDVDSVHVELLSPTDNQSTIKKFIEKRGEGFHHIAFRVDNLENALSTLSKAGIQLIDSSPRRGAGGKQIAFLHPKSTGGILVELSQVDQSYSAVTTGETGGNL